jgi:MFS transporter, DHA1 family, inner membrane transport protein
MPLALAALFAAAFAIGTAEFVIAGILPAVSSDLRISIPTAGNLVTFYALGVAIGGPVLALWTGRYSRKILLLIYVAIFTVGHVLCALAPNYPLLLAARVGIALVHGAYFGTAMVLATSIVAENKRGFAVSLILAGLTVANIIGVPLGTAIGTLIHWRATFWAVAGLGAIAGILIFALLPFDRPTGPASGNLIRELKALTREPVYSSLAVIILQTIGQFALFTYISPLLTDIAHIDIGIVPWLLLVFGLGSTIGVLVGGRLADWKLMPSLVGIMVIMTVTYLLMSFLSFQPIIMAVLVLIWGSMAFAFGAPVQTRILNNTRDAPTLAANLIPSAFNVSIAGGAWLGGTLIDAGFSYAILPWIGVVSAGLAALVAIALWMNERKSQS